MYRRLRLAWASIRRFLDTGNFLRFLVALVLAFGLWAWVTYDNDPETTRTIGAIPVSIENLADDFEVVGEIPVVDIQIQGPQSIVAPLERESLVAIVDLEDVERPGQYEVEVDPSSPSGVRVREVIPESVTIEIDRITERSEIPVDVVEPGDVPPNYQVSGIDLDPETVSLRGPERSLDLVDRVVLEVSIDGRTASFNDSLEPQAVGQNGEEVPGVQIIPAEVSVSVALDVRGQVRKVIPVIVGDDDLAPGYELVRTTVLPSDEVVIDGPESDLASVFFVTTVPIDVSGWDDSEIVRDVEIDVSALPENISLDADTVHVSIEIRRQVHEREVSGIPINVMNSAPGTEVRLQPETATVILEGPQTAVEEVSPDEITVFVNVANAGPGTHELELQVIVPAQVQYREVSPGFVDVEIIDRSEEEDLEEAQRLLPSGVLFESTPARIESARSDRFS